MLCAHCSWLKLYISGKTLAYAVPIVHTLASMSRRIQRTNGPFALVIVPTREVYLPVIHTTNRHTEITLTVLATQTGVYVCSLSHICKHARKHHTLVRPHTRTYIMYMYANTCTHTHTHTHSSDTCIEVCLCGCGVDRL